MANVHDKLLASLFQPNPCNLHGIQMSYIQNKLLLSISSQSFWCEMNAFIIVDVICIHLVSPWLMNPRRQVPGFYMGDTIFHYDQNFQIRRRGLFKNTLRLLLSQLPSNSIHTNTFYDWKWIVLCIYFISSKSGASYNKVWRGVPLVPLGGQNPPRGPGVKTRH